MIPLDVKNFIYGLTKHERLPANPRSSTFWNFSLCQTYYGEKIPLRWVVPINSLGLFSPRKEMNFPDSPAQRYMLTPIGYENLRRLLNLGISTYRPVFKNGHPATIQDFDAMYARAWKEFISKNQKEVESLTKRSNFLSKTLEKFV